MRQLCQLLQKIVDGPYRDPLAIRQMDTLKRIGTTGQVLHGLVCKIRYAYKTNPSKFGKGAEVPNGFICK